MLETKLHPDFIVVDGAEGGTGAAPLEFTNSIGTPLTDALIFVHNALNGIGFRDRVRIVASGRIVSGFDLVRLFALGADLCYSARAMMMALGCIQARRCNSNDCPVGVATQDPSLTVGLDVAHKAKRVESYQRETVGAALALIATAGLSRPRKLRPWHIARRAAPNRVEHYGELYDFVEPGSLLRADPPAQMARDWRNASAESFLAGAKPDL